MVRCGVVRGACEGAALVRKAFTAGVESVQPDRLVARHLRRDGTRLVVDGVSHELSRNVYLVGFGKAVAGMVNPIVKLLRTPDSVDHLQKGIISVPYGFEKTMKGTCDSPLVEVCEGAKDNIPDEAAFATAKKIVSLVASLSEEHLLLVLVSGGGSSLLPYPLPPLTLAEKGEVVRQLGGAGASITELNTVRKALSCTKGGRLVGMTQATVVSFILSDIIGNPLDMIASGPTLTNTDPPGAALAVLDRYNITAPEGLREALQAPAPPPLSPLHPRVTNLLIGSNEVALEAVERFVRQHCEGGCVPLFLSSSLEGEAATVGVTMAELAVALMLALSGTGTEELPDVLLQRLCVKQDKKLKLLCSLRQSKCRGCPICLIFGGETTVTVKGGGRGGRNQEMVLAASLALHQKMVEGSGLGGEVVFLSGGTDGIDGPTSAAGALTFLRATPGAPPQSQVCEARGQGLSPEDFLARNDSHSYFSQLDSGRDLLVVGHTGTNVMDLQILLVIPP